MTKSRTCGGQAVRKFLLHWWSNH